ncbi:ATP-binding protein [Photobacterium aphoticum]|uniref:Anti-sigma F factor antagonist n=2 Tax=Photobacterium aphoticum TaxID=754436 RepID=A0A0J1JLV1_9GAMM|nr:ATP-binding protein [Photobacterium aphoticum]KLV03127.1 anti-sigma F factor antagonist [Photobacterium aphoticum]PSU56537.1 ATP-binding protein [Photobacterium aphoticum]GHA51930.1 anti-sigma F factor antagonist [Photobacterium aphoticum]
MERVSGCFSKQYQSSSEVSRYIAEDMQRFLNSQSVSNEMIEQVELCLVEVVNNAYEHAYQYSDELPIDFSCFFNSEDELVIEVSDYGKAMSQEEFSRAVQGEFIEPDPDDPETWTTSGRGFIIVVQLTDGLEYNSVGDKNTFKILKRANQ